ncbi:hypothetical protein D3C72_1736420 [compost metagenome]
MLAAYRKGRLAFGAAVEIAQGDIQHVHEPVEARRHVFAPRHQVALVVAHGGAAGDQVLERRIAVEPHYAVGITVAAIDAVVQRHAHGDGHVAPGGDAAPGVPRAGIQLVLEDRQHGFGQDHQLRRGHAGGRRQRRQLQVAHQALFKQGRVEFLRLLDVALDQPHVQRVAGG